LQSKQRKTRGRRRKKGTYNAPGLLTNRRITGLYFVNDCWSVEKR
jgi:hypothetical protein